MNRRPAADTFLGAPFAAPADVAASGAARAARFAFIGLPLYVPYGDEPPAAPPAVPGAAAPTHATSAADAVRFASAAYASVLGHYDFDLGGPLVLGGARAEFVDCGDVAAERRSGGSRRRPGGRDRRGPRRRRGGGGATGGRRRPRGAAVRRAGSPDDRPLDVLQVDAHLDFRDEVGRYCGTATRVRCGACGTCTASETIVQVGLRDTEAPARRRSRPRRPPATCSCGRKKSTRGGGPPWRRCSPGGLPALRDRRRGRARPVVRAGRAVARARRPSSSGRLARLLRTNCAARCRLVGMDVCEFVAGARPAGPHGPVVGAPDS